MHTASKSLKQARNIVLLSYFMPEGLIKLDFAWLYSSDMSYFIYSAQLLHSEFLNTDNITYLLNRLINERKLKAQSKV